MILLKYPGLMKYPKPIIVLLFVFIYCIISGWKAVDNEEKQKSQKLIISKTVELERDRVIAQADKLILEMPKTITAFPSSRSPGGRNDFFSEGPYWWPDPENPNGPFIRKDGLRYPGCFKDHDNAVSRFSWIVSTETSAYLLTGDEKYVKAAMKQLEAWFIDPETMMNPHWSYGQAIQGICTGRGAGFIDASPLIDVVQSVMYLENSPFMSEEDILKIKEWFTKFLNWMTTHEYGIKEMNAKNNHGTWWHAQAAIYAKFTGNKEVLKLCHDRLFEIILPNQMSADGSLPQELARTKPYSYSLFNLDALSVLTLILSDGSCDLWNKTLPDGRGLTKGIDFMMTYIRDISKWPFSEDVTGWEDQPGRRTFILLDAIARDNPESFSLWLDLDKKMHHDDSMATFALKCPLLWLGLKDPLSRKTY